MIDFEPGQRVRIRADAFGDSTESPDVQARGQVGILLYRLDADIWQWRGDDGTETAPIERELEAMDRPTIVCLCGSTRFYTQFTEANYRETMDGKIVLSVGFYPHATQEMYGEEIGVTPEQKQALDQLHLRKIDLADEVVILNVGGYVGESTARELAYAQATGKRVRFLEEQAA